MSDEKKSVSEDSNMTDYANLAFNPYATSTDDLTFSTFGNGDAIKNGKSMENGGFEPEHFVEKNPHYEDTAEVIEKAGLGGTGRRKKENIVYEAAGLKKKPKLSEKRPEPPQLRASNIPPRPAEDWRGISKDINNTRWKLPFLILCILFLICLVGAAFGVIAYLRDETCSCSSNLGITAARKTGDNETSAQQIAALQGSLDTIKTELDTIKTELDTMKAMFHELQRNQATQKEESLQVTETLNASVIFVHRQLNSAIQTVNATFNVKLQNVNNSISSLNGDVEKLKNVSKQMGPRGFNGTQGPPGLQGLAGAQGPQGEPGIGNISACRVGERFQKGLTATNKLEKVTVDHEAVAGWKVLSAVCTTKEHAGTIHTVLSQSNNRYQCTCAGESTYSLFTPTTPNGAQKELFCGIIYWECPEHT